MKTKKTINELTYKIIGAAMEVHKELGPGLLESVYQKCLKYEFKQRGLFFQSELEIDLLYKGIRLNTELRCDFLVENSIVVELKAVEYILPVHKAQALTYMKLIGKPKGILVNFNCENIFRNGQITLVNELFAALPDE